MVKKFSYIINNGLQQNCPYCTNCCYSIRDGWYTNPNIEYDQVSLTKFKRTGLRLECPYCENHCYPARQNPYFTYDAPQVEYKPSPMQPVLTPQKLMDAGFFNINILNTNPIDGTLLERRPVTTVLYMKSHQVIKCPQSDIKNITTVNRY